MHELSIATSLVELTERALADAGEDRPVEAVRVRIGALAGVVTEALRFSWDVAIDGTRCAGSRLEIEEVPGRVRCPACTAETELPNPPRFRCGVCDTPTADILAGQELELISLELQEAPHEAVEGVTLGADR